LFLPTADITFSGDEDYYGSTGILYYQLQLQKNVTIYSTIRFMQ